MGKQQRVNITSDIYKKQNVLEKMMPEHQQEEEQEEEEQLQPIMKPQSQSSKPVGGRTLKQAAFAIGIEREVKLDELALAYNKKNGTRIGRNDIIRYLIDNLTLEELLRTNLKEYKK